MLYLSEVRERVEDDLQLQPHEVPSLSAICLCIQRLNFTSKKIVKIPMERYTAENMRRREAFINWRKTIDATMIFFTDETGYHVNMNCRKYARSRPNEAVPIITLQRGQTEKWSVVALVCYNQEVTQAVPVPVNCNAFLFNFILENQLLPLLPFNSCLVIDNASVHVDAQIQPILAQKSITLIKLPTYSYDLNPIEMVFGFAKAYARRMPGSLRQNIPIAILDSFQEVSLQSVQRAYKNSWRVDH